MSSVSPAVLETAVDDEAEEGDDEETAKSCYRGDAGRAQLVTLVTRAV